MSTVTTVDEALERLAESPFDLIVLDIIMSPNSARAEMKNAGITDAGVHLAAAVRKKAAFCKIIILTNFYQKAVFDWFSRDPNSRVLLKVQSDPFRFVEEVNSIMVNRKPAPRVFIVHGRDKVAWLESKELSAKPP